MLNVKNIKIKIMLISISEKMLQKSKIMHQKIKVTLIIKSNKEKPFLSQD